jgi:hypothetical protein
MMQKWLFFKSVKNEAWGRQNTDMDSVLDLTKISWQMLFPIIRKVPIFRFGILPTESSLGQIWENSDPLPTNQNLAVWSFELEFFVIVS